MRVVCLVLLLLVLVSTCYTRVAFHGVRKTKSGRHIGYDYDFIRE